MPTVHSFSSAIFFRVRAEREGVEPLEWPVGGQNLRVVDRIAELNDKKFPVLRGIGEELLVTSASITGGAAADTSDDDVSSSDSGF